MKQHDVRPAFFPKRRRTRSPYITGMLVAFLAFAAGCGRNAPTEPDEAPVITISGVEDGGSYAGPVVVTIDLDRGSYNATLDGRTFHSGEAVTTPGAHVLQVTARAGVATSTAERSFSIDAPAGGVLIVRMLDLGPNGAGGGGDAILVTDSSAAGMVHALLDAGPAGANASNPGYVAQRLEELGVDSLMFMLLTHAHSDHFQGMTDVLNEVHVRDFIYNGQQRNLSFYNSLVALAGQRADTVIVPADTMGIAFGRSAVQSRFTVIPALSSYLDNANASSDHLNEGSLGARLGRGDFSMFFTGDGEVEANHRWRTTFADLSRTVDVLKVGHHGANNAIFDDGFGSNPASAWLEHTDPIVSIISANGSSHPRIRALGRLLQKADMDTYCTNVHGEITLRIWSDGTVHVEVERNGDADCVPGSEATS